MPIHEYLLPDGTKVERIFYPTEKVPDEIKVRTSDDDGDPVVWIGKKVISRTVVKFATPMSGGTKARDLVHKDDGTYVEPGRLNDVKNRRKELDAQREDARRKVIEESLADYNV